MKTLHKLIIRYLRSKMVAVTAFEISDAIQYERTMVNQAVNHINKTTTYQIGRVKRSDGKMMYWIEG